MVLSKHICRRWGKPLSSMVTISAWVLFHVLTSYTYVSSASTKAHCTCSVLQLESDLSITSAYAFHVNKPLGVYSRLLKLYSTVALGHIKCTYIIRCLWLVHRFSCKHHGIRKKQTERRQYDSRLSAFWLLHNHYSPRHFLRILYVV